MKKKILILSVIILISAVCVSGTEVFNGKGECPDQLESCDSNTQCPGYKDCAPGYYCEEQAELLACEYPGFQQSFCEAAEGVWTHGLGTLSQAVCVKGNRVEGMCDSCNSLTECVLGSSPGSPHQCFEGSLCVNNYCAPPDFSEKHCTLAEGTWDAMNENCINLETCSDGIQNQDETDVDCGGICAVRQKCDVGQSCKINSDCDSNNCGTDVYGNEVCIGGGTCGDGKCDEKEDYFSCAKDCKLSSESLKLLDAIEKKMCLKPNDICCKRLQIIFGTYKTPEAKETELKPEVTKASEPNKLSFNLFTRLKQKLRSSIRK